MIRNAIVSTFGFLCTAMVVISTLIGLVTGFHMQGLYALLFPLAVFLVSAFVAGGALTLVSIADNAREALDVLRRMEQAQRNAPQPRAPQPRAGQANT